MKKTGQMLVYCLLLIFLPIFHLSIYAASEYDRGYEMGISLGESIGNREGKIDFGKGLARDWERSLPSDQSIKNEYSDLIGNGDDYRRYRNGFIAGYKEGYENAYNETYEELYRKESVDHYTAGYNKGYSIGTLDGREKGEKRFLSGKPSSWENDIEKDSLLTKQYELSRENREYQRGFLQGYKEGFKKTYIDIFREKFLGESEELQKLGYDHGYTSGEEDGKIKGYMDFLNNMESNWTRALASDYTITIQYDLSSLEQDYIDGFLTGYKDSFPASYQSSYAESSLVQAKENEKKWEVGMLGATIKTSDNNVIVTIEEGTLYQNRFFSIQKRAYPTSSIRYQYTCVSPVYDIKLDESIYPQKPLKLSFQYTGNKNGGIYELRDGEWTYLPSVIKNSNKEGRIGASIQPSVYSGGRYAVFIDNAVHELEDIQNHWAKEEIYTLLRRNDISGYSDNTFKPSNTITRAEFLTILNHMGKLEGTPKEIDITKFRDYTIFGSYLPHIERALAIGFIQGYPDGTFRPHMPITYQEIQLFIQRLPEHSDFQWKGIAEKLRTEKNIRSKSYDGMDRYITRAETVYVLSLLDQ